MGITVGIIVGMTVPVSFAAVAYQRVGNKKGCCHIVLALVASEPLF